MSLFALFLLAATTALGNDDAPPQGLQPGDRAPDLIVPGERADAAFDLSRFRRKQPVVLLMGLPPHEGASRGELRSLFETHRASMRFQILCNTGHVGDAYPPPGRENPWRKAAADLTELGIPFSIFGTSMIEPDLPPGLSAYLGAAFYIIAKDGKIAARGKALAELGPALATMSAGPAAIASATQAARAEAVARATEGAVVHALLGEVERVVRAAQTLRVTVRQTETIQGRAYTFRSVLLLAPGNRMRLELGEDGHPPERVIVSDGTTLRVPYRLQGVLQATVSKASADLCSKVASFFVRTGDLRAIPGGRLEVQIHSPRLVERTDDHDLLSYRVDAGGGGFRETRLWVDRKTHLPTKREFAGYRERTGIVSFTYSVERNPRLDDALFTIP